jgi:hypothetical protein
MSERVPHLRTLLNHERAVITEAKVRYALRDRDKRRAFQALGYKEERGNWRALRDAIFESLPLYPAPVSHEDRWGLTCNVDMPISGSEGKTAPVRTKWIFRLPEGEDFPRLVTLYVKTTEWKRTDRGGRA